MKNVLILLGLWMAALLFVAEPVWATPDIAPGDTSARVAAVLGEPEGYLKIQELELLYFDRGTVEIRGGLVVRADLISAETLALRRAEALRNRLRAEQDRLAARERLIKEGLAVRERVLSDPEFLAADPDYRDQFWQAFREKYPDVDVADAHADALDALKATVSARIADAEARARERAAAFERERELAKQRELAELRELRELAELRERTAAAERRAEESARAAERARAAAQRVYVVGASHYTYPSTVVHAPVVRTTTRSCEPVTQRSAVLRNFTSPWAYDRSYRTPFFNDPHYVTRSSYETAVSRIGIRDD